MMKMKMNMNRSSRKAILSALVAASLITGAEAKSAIFIPAAPAIIKPAKLWVPHEKKLLQAGPLPVGIFAVAGSGGGVGIPSPSFRAAYTDTATSANKSFATCDLGTPHALRMIVVIASTNNVAVSACNVDGTGGTLVIDETTSNSRISMWRAASVTNPTGTITITHASTTNGVIGVYAVYPSSQTPVDAISLALNASACQAFDLAKTNAGFTIAAGSGNGGSAGVITQTGPETIIEDYDAVITGGLWLTFAHHVNTATSTTDDYTSTITSSSRTATLAASWF